MPGGFGGVSAVAEYDDGSGPALFVAGRSAPQAGEFSLLFGKEIGPVARWNGTEFEATTVDAPHGIEAMCVFDDGSGPKLYAGGDFNIGGSNPATDLAVWDGTSWSGVGNGGISGGAFDFPYVTSLAVHDDGTGERLYIGGQFTLAGGQAIQNLATWDGNSFQAAGEPNNVVLALHSMELAGTPALFAGGFFSSVGGTAANTIAGLTPGGWVSMGTSSIFADVRALASFDFGSGPVLVVGGNGFQVAGSTSSGVSSFDGTGWSQVGDPFFGTVEDFAVADLGSGPELFLGGWLKKQNGDPADHLAHLSGGAWVEIGGGTSNTVDCLGSFTFGQESRLVIGGNFATAGMVYTNGYATWDGSEFEPSGTGLNGWAHSLEPDPFGSGLIVAGDFDGAGDQTLAGIARFESGAFSPLGGSDGFLRSLTSFDFGAGPELVAGGRFAAMGGIDARNVGRFDGTDWHPLGAGLWGSFNSTVEDLMVFDDGSGPALIAGGSFTESDGVPIHLVGRWDGALWQPFGSGLAGPGAVGRVYELAVFDDGNGPELYAGGLINSHGEGVSRWDGSGWHDLDGGLQSFSTSDARAFAVFDDGTGPALYVGGRFESAGSAAISSPNIARWQNGAWTAVAGGLPGVIVESLVVHDVGAGPQLFAGGSSTSASSGQAKAQLHRLDGTGWSSIEAGTFGALFDLLSVPGDGLYAAGSFSGANSAGDSHVGRFACPTESVVAWPGCFGPKPQLTSPNTAAKIGSPVDLVITGSALGAPTALFFAQALSVSPAGCGTFVPGFGEVLLELQPFPSQFASVTAVAGSIQLQQGLPNNPTLVGQSTTIQSLLVDPAESEPFELSSALQLLFVH